MPSPPPPFAPPPLPRVSPAPAVMPTIVQPLWPTLGPSYPKAGATGLVVVALAYFSLGVAVGALLKQTPGGRRWLPFVVVPGVVAGLAFIAWVFRSLR